jgi:cob(I)alamin adenosyltransferase
LAGISGWPEATVTFLYFSAIAQFSPVSWGEGALSLGRNPMSTSDFSSSVSDESIPSTDSSVNDRPDDGLTPEQYRKKMERRKAVQEQRLAARDREKGLIIVHTGNGKGKTTAALGMVLRSLGHGYRVAIVQFIKGAWEPAEKTVLEQWAGQLDFHAMGEGFTWETQDRERDVQMAQAAWEKAMHYIHDAEVNLTLLDEVNVALKLGYLSVEQVLDGLNGKPEMSHVILTGRGAPSELIERADLVTEMTLVKHPFREQGVKAQAGIEY